MEAAKWVSQRLAHSSTHHNADRLNFRVRDGYGCNPAAMAALTPIHGIEPCAIRQYRWFIRTVIYVQSSSRLDPSMVVRIAVQSDECVAQPVSTRGLNASLPRRVHPKPIELVFYEWLLWYLFSRWVSSLDAFSSYPVLRGCPARALSDNRYTSGNQS